jgi:hypothetical protein
MSLHLSQGDRYDDAPPAKFIGWSTYTKVVTLSCCIGSAFAVDGTVSSCRFRLNKRTYQ